MKWAVLVGGTGSNLAALLRHGLGVELVVSHRRGVLALEVAREYGVPTVTLLPNAYPSREAYGDALRAELVQAKVDAVALAGFMRWLDCETVNAWSGRIFNIHPSLLPSFSGLNAVAQALAHGVRWTGVTVHVVDEGEDSGPIVAQVPVPIHRNDTEETLSARIHRAEHALYGPVLKAYEAKGFEVQGRNVVWHTGAPDLERGSYAVGVD